MGRLSTRWCSRLSLPAVLAAIFVALPLPLESSPMKVMSTPGGSKAYFLPLLEAKNMSASGVIRRFLQRRNLAEARMWLYGHVLTEGYYYTMLGLGTPPQQFALIVDTGSTVTYVPCKSCTHCGKQHQDNPYIPASSSSYEAVACDSEDCPGRQCGPNQVCSYSRHYAEDSTSSGIIASDLATFGPTSSIEPTRILFGCETSETGDLYTQRADGIIGMGKGTLGIMNQLVLAKATEDQFSLCYGGMERGGGSMIMGAVPPPPGMKFVPLDSRPGEGTYYNVAVEGILVAGENMNLASSMFNAGYGSVLDSGTTFTYLPGPAFQAVKAAVTRAVSAKGLNQVAGPDPHYDDVCFGPATDDPSKLSNYFPPITFIFRPNVTYELAPENFLFRHTGDQNAYCLGLFENKDHGTLLGGILVRNTMVTYDRSGAKVGFWKTNCADLFEILNNIQGPDAPPLPPQLADEPPSDVEPTTAGLPAGMNPPSTAPATSNCEGCAKELKIAFRVSVPESSFGDLKDFFCDDVARELSIDKEQVSDLTYEAAPAGVSGSEGKSTTTTEVDFVVLPPTEASILTAQTVKRIQAVLQNTEFSLRDAFGAVSLQSFVLVPPTPAPSSPWYWYVVGAVVFVALAGIAVFLVRRRSRPPKFDALEEERREEKAALADSGEGDGRYSGQPDDVEHQQQQQQPSGPARPHEQELQQQGQERERERERLTVESSAPLV